MIDTHVHAEHAGCRASAALVVGMSSRCNVCTALWRPADPLSHKCGARIACRDCMGIVCCQEQLVKSSSRRSPPFPFIHHTNEEHEGDEEDQEGSGSPEGAQSVYVIPDLTALIHKSHQLF